MDEQQTPDPSPMGAGHAPAHGAASPAQERKAAAQAARLERAERKAMRQAERQAKGPGAWRTWVLPSLRLLVAAVIAIALVKFAFFPDQATEAGGDEVPSAMMEEPLVPATIGTVSNDVELQGQVVPDERVPVLATQSGTVNWIGAEDGAEVGEGDPLYQVQVESQPELTGDEDPEAEAPAPSVQYFTITAPATGMLADFEVLVGQDVQIATETGAIQPPSFHVEAPLTAEQQYRLTTEPSDAEVQIPGGPAPFACAELEIVQPTSGGGGGEGGETGGEGAASAIARCVVPDGVRVFSGLAGTMTIAAGVAEDVLTLPTTAVLGSADSGIVFQVGEDGEPVEVEVSLGLNDGALVEITDGLADGDMVMEFAPGAEPIDPCADPATADPMVCGEVFP